MNQEKDDLVFYDGRLMPRSQASVFIQEDVKRRQDFLKEHPEHAESGSPTTNPAAEWDRQELSLNQRFKTFYKEADDTDAQQDAIAEAIAAEKCAATKAIEAEHRAIAEAIKADNRDCGFVESPESMTRQRPLPEGVYWLDNIVKQSWCARYYKTEARLIKYLLQPHEYPPRLTALGLLTRAKFDTLISKKLKKRREKDRARKETTAAKQAADQVSEPVNGPGDASPLVKPSRAPQAK